MAPITEVRAEIWDSQALINVVVTVVDANGAEGVGETWWGIADSVEPARAGRPMASVVNDVLAPRVVGQDSGDIGAIWADLTEWAARYGDSGILLMGVSGIDLALWDLASRSSGQTVCDLLGGSKHERLPAYASLPWLLAEDLVLAETRRAVDAGFRAVKLHEVDPGMATAVRREFGPDLAIMVDVNGHFGVPDAIEHAAQLHEIGVLWFEEPVHPMRDHAVIAQVAEAMDPALAAGENEYSVADFERLLSSTPVRYVQPELTKIGGLTPANEIAAAVERHGRELCPHNFRVGPSMVASMHWAFSSPVGNWLEIPWFQEHRSCSFPTPLPRIEDGCVAAPSRVGLAGGSWKWVIYESWERAYREPGRPRCGTWWNACSMAAAIT